MRLYGLRLLIALLTFAAGIAANSLLSFERTTRCISRVETQSMLVSSPEPTTVDSRQSPPLLVERPYKDDRGVINSGMLNGMVLSEPKPAYPRVAKVAGASGPVRVRVLVNEDGRVLTAEAESGHPLLRQEAVSAALRARFEPVLLSGRPVKFSGVLVYNFKPE
jgi:TonB family protein